MEEVKVTELRRNLAKYLARVQRGQRMRITSRDKIIAELVPPLPSRKEIEAARARLRGSVLRYDGPVEPVTSPTEWAQ